MSHTERHGTRPYTCPVHVDLDYDDVDTINAAHDVFRDVARNIPRSQMGFLLWDYLGTFRTWSVERITWDADGLFVACMMLFADRGDARSNLGYAARKQAEAYCQRVAYQLTRT